jgi:PKD repeat protein
MLPCAGVGKHARGKKLRSLRVVVPLTVLALLAILAGPASAVIRHLPGGKVVSYLPVPGKRAAQSQQQRLHSFDEAFSNLDYNGGPVMSSNTDYVLYWRPSTATAYPSDYKSGVKAYFEALAHDSGGHQNADSVAAQYNDASGQFANYDVKFGGELEDKHPYPASGCEEAPICLTDEQIQTEIAKFVSEEELPTGLGVEYFLLTPEGVESCFEGGEAEVCSANSEEPFYCAYHEDIQLGGGGVLLYANDPFVNGKNCDKPADHINGSSDSVLFGGLSHEHLETVTDPEPNNAWTDYMTGEETGYEVADKCNGGEVLEFGTPLGKVEVSGKQVPYNQEIDGRKYYIQQEWSNQGHNCRQRFTFSGAEPTASFTAKVGSPNTTVSLDASESTAPGGVSAYSWSFDSGAAVFESEGAEELVGFPEAGQFRVALTVFAPDGTSIGAARTLAIGGSGPSASIGVSASPLAGQPVSFDGSGSSDAPSGPIAAYEWSFGDGSAAGGASPSHTYASAGTYTVTLTVTGSDGLNARATRSVSVSAEGGGGGGGGGGTPPPPVTTAGSSPATATPPPASTPGPAAAAADSSFTFKPATNAKTGAITLTISVLDPGKLTWGSIFANGKFGAFASSSKCKKGQVSLRGRCLPAKISFAKGSRTLAAAGSVVLTLKPSASALKALKAALKQRKGVPVSIVLSFQSSRGGAPVSHAQTVTVKLKK